MPPANRPIQEFKVGRVTAKIWQNIAADQAVWFKVTFSCRYRRADLWHESTSFHREDLPLVELAARHGLVVDADAVRINEAGLDYRVAFVRAADGED